MVVQANRTSTAAPRGRKYSSRTAAECLEVPEDSEVDHHHLLDTSHHHHLVSSVDHPEVAGSPTDPNDLLHAPRAMYTSSYTSR